MIPVVVSKSLVGDDPNGIAASQSLASAGNLDLGGVLSTNGVATLDTPRRIIVTPAGDETGVNYTFYGTIESGAEVSQTVAGAAIAFGPDYDFKTVTRVATDAATVSTVEVGTNTVGATRWIQPSVEMTPVQLSLAVVVSGSVNFTVQYTYDQPNPPAAQTTQPVPIPLPWDLTALQNKTANTASDIDVPIAAYRLQVNSGTGTATLTAIQSGIAGN